MYWLYSLLFFTLTLIFGKLFLSKRLTFLILNFTFFIIISGNYYNGIDWLNYIFTFDSFYNNEFNELSMAYEPLFLLLNYIASRLGSDFHILVILISFIWFIRIHQSEKNVYVNSSAFLVIFFIMSAPIVIGEGLRQGLALAVLLPSIINLRQCTHKKWMTNIIIASLCHFSAVFIYPIFFVLRIEFDNKRLATFFTFLCTSAFIILNLQFILSSIDFGVFSTLSRKLSSFYDNGGGSRFGVGIIVDAFMIVTLLYYRKLDYKKGNILAWNGALLYFSLHAVFYLLPYFQRFNSYLLPLLAMYITSCISAKKSTLWFYIGLILIAYNLLGFFQSISNPYYRHPYNNPMFFYASGFSEHDKIYYRGVNTCNDISYVDEDFCRKFILTFK